MQKKGTPRLWNTFVPASLTLDNDGAEIINDDIPVTSAIKHKNHKVGNGLI